MTNSVVVVGSLHYDIMVDAPDRPRKGETVAGRSWAPKFGGKGGNQAIAAQPASCPDRDGGSGRRRRFWGRAARRPRPGRRRSVGRGDVDRASAPA